MKFEKVGKWRMHDHLIPHMTGTIVVLENPENKAPTAESESMGLWAKIKAFFKKFFQKPPPKASASKFAWLESLAEKEGAEAAWKYLLKTYDTPKGVVGNPHDMAHLVGQLLFKERGFKGLSTCTPVFAFGCYHGLMEVAFDENDAKSYQENILKAEKSCEKLGGEENPAYWSCVHGMGHGIITFREHNTSLALNDCNLLKERMQHYCYDGIFMELSASAAPSFYKKNDPLYPCSSLKEQYLSGCARAQARVMQSRFGLSTREVAQICLESGDKTIRFHCIESLGYNAAQANIEDPRVAIAYCENIVNSDDQAQCKAAAAGEFVFQNAIGWQKSSTTVCESMDADYKSACRARVAQVKKVHSRE